MTGYANANGSAPCDRKSGTITFVFQGRRFNPHTVICSFNEGDVITVDWGDGCVETFKTVTQRHYNYRDIEYEEAEGETMVNSVGDFSHAYGYEHLHVITVKGNIRGVGCDYNELTSLDASGCPELEWLDCSWNELNALNVKGCAKLGVLHCFENKLAALDVSRCTALTELCCHGNKLTSLEVGGCTKLEWLNCRDNRFAALDIRDCAALTWLFCQGNSLTSLDVSGNAALKFLDCHSNKLTSLEISKNYALTKLYCVYNELTASTLNRIFSDLPDVNRGAIYINGNPGIDTCDKSIARKKGWDVISSR